MFSVQLGIMFLFLLFYRLGDFIYDSSIIFLYPPINLISFIADIFYLIGHAFNVLTISV